MQNKKQFWLGALLIFIVSAFAYLPLVKNLGYLNDDWYQMYDMLVKGPSFYHEIFAIDRPGRALAMIPLFTLFGFNPLWYHLSAFFFRMMGGIFLFWTGRMLWKERNFFALVTGLLFAIYPGFLSQPNAIDYQSHILALFLAMLSVALTVQSLLVENLRNKVLLIAGSILAGWGALSQMEYYIGIEGFRFAAIIMLMWRGDGTFRQKVMKVIKASLPFLLVAAGFLIWRLFFFESARKATDVSLQVLQVISSPLTALWWLNYLLQDFFTVTLAAWTMPVYQLAFPMRLKDMAIALALSAVAVGVVLVALRWRGEKASEAEPTHSGETLFLSLVTMLGGLVPVILVNRHVTLPDYSRYTLIASVGAVMLIALLIESLARRGAQITVIGILVSIAVMTHYGNTIRSVYETKATRNFWQQVAWRAPNIEDGVTLIASYPNSPLAEDYFIWGPANFIYRPEKQSNNPVVVRLPAAVLTGDVVNQIAAGSGVETPLRRGNYLERDFGNVLVMIQTREDGCVRIIDGDAPELSPSDADRLKLIAPRSRLDAVITDGESPTPPVNIFGKEPEHGWCYFYQKADLARQRGEWEEIPVLLNQALDGGYYPNDSLEWMPFLQAAAIQDDVKQVREMTKIVTADKILGIQVCNLMTDFAQEQTLSDEMKSVIEQGICK
ncbi:hypothetical protein ANAEL_00744 [Anaerolineales bacterium]|nr:hypothetical protein ANAEL_00744 [Anaerolineales bacterium]